MSDKVERPFTLKFSEHDLRHIRETLRRVAIQSDNWGRVRCAVGIYDRINEQLSEKEKNMLAGPPEPQRKRCTAEHRYRKSDLVGWFCRCSCGKDFELKKDWMEHRSKEGKQND